MFWLRNKKNTFLLRTFIWRPDSILYLGQYTIFWNLPHIIGLVKQKIFQRKVVIIFLPINFNICVGCSKELSQ